jgi:hypothetical protein
LIDEELAVVFTGSATCLGFATGATLAAGLLAAGLLTAGISIIDWQPGQRAFLPAAESATWRTF